MIASHFKLSQLESYKNVVMGVEFMSQTKQINMEINNRDNNKIKIKDQE